MTRDEIISMAREAGFPFNKYGALKGDSDGEIDADEMFERFAELVAAAEREECVKVCDDYAVDQWNLYKGRHPYTGEESGRADPETQGQCLGAEYLADAIRARGEKGQS